MGYVSEMRALVGQRPLILVGAGVLIEDAAGRILLQRRTDDGLWSIPGGSVELNETVEAAARREVREETGLVVGELTLFGVFSGPELFHVYPNGDQAALVIVAFRTRDVSGTLSADNVETLELRYFALSELSALPVVAPNRPILRQLVRTI